MVRQTLTIARNAFLESVRQPVYFIVVVLAAILLIFTTASTGYSMAYSDASEVGGDNKLLLDIGLATVFVAGGLLAAFIATAVLTREIENRTVLTVVSKPIPRPVLVIGKYLGVAIAMIIATLIMLAVMQMAVRHGVLTTAADRLDGPVIIFGLLAFLISVGVAGWCNYFYGWVFSQTATLLLCPLMLLAWLGVLLVGKGWVVQPIGTDFLPQITIAAGAMILAQLVLTAIAIAASTRCGQVMTIVVASIVFFVGLLSNGLFGSNAIRNTHIGKVIAAEPVLAGHTCFEHVGDAFTLEFEFPPHKTVRPGDSFYYGPNPNGFALAVPNFTPFEGDVNSRTDKYGEGVPAGVIVESVDGKEIVIRHIGNQQLAKLRVPGPGDYAFLQPTQFKPIWIMLWGVVPNMQIFWLADAVTQGHNIPLSHLLLVVGYAFAQIVAILALAIFLFQGREVG